MKHLEETLIANLDQMLQAVETCPLHQKLDCSYKAGRHLSRDLLAIVHWGTPLGQEGFRSHSHPLHKEVGKFDQLSYHSLALRMGELNIPALTSLYIQTPASVMAVSAAHFWPWCLCQTSGREEPPTWDETHQEESKACSLCLWHHRLLSLTFEKDIVIMQLKDKSGRRSAWEEDKHERLTMSWEARSNAGS